MEINHLKVIFASDIPGVSDFPWDSFSFGDAAYTLVTIGQLIEEVDDANVEYEGRFDDLLNELRSVPLECFVAFEG
jgi:hypothetical protein